MRIAFATAVVTLLCLGCIAQAVTIETVVVGAPGNIGDTEVMSIGGGTGYGSVGYTYAIGKYEVTAGQYTEFLNAVARTDTYGLYNTQMYTCVTPWGEFGLRIQRTGSPGSYTYNVAADWANRPVALVSFWDACRFANWLHNGQPTGLQDASTTEDGAYTLNGYTGLYGGIIGRNPGARWALPTEDEWYKAAYYKGGGANAGYWDYPTQSDTLPSNVCGDGYTDPGNHANYYGTTWALGSPYYRTRVGEFENSAGAYGTFDMGGNVEEWNESVQHPGGSPHDSRGRRGGAYWHNSTTLMSNWRLSTTPDHELQYLGFRLVAVPEPSSLLALGGGLLALGGLIRRRR